MTQTRSARPSSAHARRRTHRKSTAPARDVYQEVTDRIVTELERGVFPWTQPWDVGKGGPVVGSAGMPVNVSTGNAYSGVNILLLWIAAAEHGYASQRWLTYKQAQALGGQVRRGQTSTAIVRADTFVPKGERQAAANENREAGRVPFLKIYRVFNAAQVDGLPDDMGEPGLTADLSSVDVDVRTILERLGTRLVVGTARACYIPAVDTIQLPSPEAFHEPVDWNRTALHESGHATGAKHRLDRDLTGWFGGEDYAKEELVAELTAAFCCARLGIRPTVRHADYIGAWLAKLRDDKRCVVQAASAASKAADLLIGMLDRHGDGTGERRVEGQPDLGSRAGRPSSRDCGMTHGDSGIHLLDRGIIAAREGEAVPWLGTGRSVRAIGCAAWRVLAETAGVLGTAGCGGRSG